MSSNKKLVEEYLATADRTKLGPMLADDVEWIEWGDNVPPTGVRHKGKAAYIENYGDDELTGEIVRLVEEGNAVVAEGIAHVRKKDGRKFNVRFVDLFEIEHGRIKRKSSYGALLKESA
jgi:uncharacterized protein